MGVYADKVDGNLRPLDTMGNALSQTTSDSSRGENGAEFFLRGAEKKKRHWMVRLFGV